MLHKHFTLLQGRADEETLGSSSARRAGLPVTLCRLNNCHQLLFLKQFKEERGKVQAGLTLTYGLKRDSRNLKSVSIRILPVLLHTHPQEKDVYRMVLAEEMLFLVPRG